MKELVEELLQVSQALSKEVNTIGQEEETEEEEGLTYSESEEMYEVLKRNSSEFTTLKLIEEIAELQEKLIKYHLKSASHKPKLKEILDEVGDVGMRITLFVEHHTTEDFDATEYVEERVEKKLKKLYGYYKEGKYKGGL